MTFAPPPLPPPSLPPPPAPPSGSSARPSGIRRHAGRLAAGFVVLAVAAAVVGVQITGGGRDYPSSWDPRVDDLVQFDEAHRGLRFKHPVPIDFLTPEEYSARARVDSSALTDEDRSQIELYAGELKALGLIEGDPDLFGAQNDLNDAGTLAYYDPDAERITVRGTEMTPGLRVTLVHELTHVLQDQWFDVGSSRTNEFTTSQEDSAFRALIEGDAVRIENEYLDTLSEDERAAADEAVTLQPDDTSLDAVPAALQAFDFAPYAVGPPAVELLAATGGDAAVDAALRRPPTTDRELLDPRALEAHSGAREVDEPALPDGVHDSLDSGDLGSITWYLLLAERIDPAAALDAVDGWAGDAYVAYEQDGVTCMALAFAGTDDDATARMRGALDDWAAAMPGGKATVARDGDGLLVRSCDPGGQAATNERALDAMQLAAIRIEGAFEAVDQGGLDLDTGFEYGECLIHTITFEQIQQAGQAAGELPDELASDIGAAYTSCVAKVGG